MTMGLLSKMCLKCAGNQQEIRQIFSLKCRTISKEKNNLFDWKQSNYEIKLHSLVRGERRIVVAQAPLHLR